MIRIAFQTGRNAPEGGEGRRAVQKADTDHFLKTVIERARRPDGYFAG
jgi:hypothetical protein